MKSNCSLGKRGKNTHFTLEKRGKNTHFTLEKRDIQKSILYKPLIMIRLLKLKKQTLKKVIVEFSSLAE